ncbi:MAG: PAS domain S-box protein [Proteobacteria bacterium]|nr:PAS domain S-box protein [Pseudomonadota bacterium]MDA1357712.1 PAS domain S-box protein [Pseudomonadota bacterium]
MVGSNSDITASKEAEAVLRERDEMHATVADLSEDLIWIFTDGVIVYCNDYAVHALGLKQREDLIGTSVLSLLHPRDHETAKLQFAQLLKEGIATPSREIRLVRPDGKELIVETKACPYRYQDKPSVLAIARDITQRKGDIKKLRESEAKLRQLADGSIAGVLIHRNNKSIIANQTYAEIFGYSSPEEIFALDSILYLIAPHDRDRIAEYGTRRTAGKSAPDIYQFQGTRQDGSLIWVESHASIIDWDGEPATQITLIDISERKAAEEALSDSNSLLVHVQEMAHLGSWEIDYEKNMVTWSDEMYRLIGLERSDYDGQPGSFLSHVHPDDRDRVARNAEEQRNGKDLECLTSAPMEQTSRIA